MAAWADSIHIRIMLIYVYDVKTGMIPDTGPTVTPPEGGVNARWRSTIAAAPSDDLDERPDHASGQRRGGARRLVSLAST